MKPDGTDQYSEEQANRLAYLVAGYLRQTLSEKEHDELDEWLTTSDENQRLFEELIDPVAIKKGLNDYYIPDTKAALKRIKKKLKFTTSPAEKTHKKQRIIRYSIAASVLLLISLAILFVSKDYNDSMDNVLTEKQDLPSGGNRATLLLANGKLIDLEKIKNGLIDSAEGPDVLKTSEGQLSYEPGKDLGKGHHILTTPAGGQYSVALPDGTRIWLNASSSLKYPVVFDEKERVVELTGEGYFEVKKEKPADLTGMELGRRFIVKLKNDVKIEVLGTHFNIMAYDDEQVIQATLLEGSVNVKSIAMGDLIGAGEQSTILKDGFIRSQRNADTSMVVAWKNGRFQFKDAPIETIMRQVARWYNAEIVYEGNVDYHFNATTIYRSEPLSKLLGVLEATNRVHFKIEGKRVFVRE
jgi:ferric-dicitrate binding protein FerR (iron transport regulator)